MKILITGGAGFIASQITDAYLSEGHKVFVLDNLTTGYKQNVNPKAVFIEADIRDENLKSLFEKEKFDVVNHHAAQMDVRHSVADPVFDAEINILGSLNLLKNSVSSGVKKFMFASSGGAIYGEQTYFPADEEHPQFPLSPYGISKLAVEKYLYFYRKQYNLDYTILRYANVYGPRQNPFGEAGVVAIFTTRLLKKMQPVINGTGLQTRDYVFIEDVVETNLKTLTEPGSAVYNVGTAVETDVNTIFSILNDLTSAQAEEKHGNAAPGEQMRSVISSEKLYKNYNWKPSIGIREGLRKTVSYFKSITIPV